MLDATGATSDWLGEPLPAPLAPLFDSWVTQWLNAAGKEVIDPATWPNGPIILMQIANEGIYTNGALPLSAYDYSPSALAFYRERLKDWYGTLEEYNRVHGVDGRRTGRTSSPRGSGPGLRDRRSCSPTPTGDASTPSTWPRSTTAGAPPSARASRWS